MKRLSLSILLLALGLAGPAGATGAERADAPFLSQGDAAARAARVSNVDYALDFTLTGKESFSGTSTIAFDLNDASEALTIDLNQASITRLSVNGKPLTPQYNQWFIRIPGDALRAGRNVVVVAYARKHSTNGEGLHRMVDPADGRVYTYSQFGPAAAQQAFAAFDQPDLKASYQITATAPADWQVVSTTLAAAVEPAPGGRRWRFPKTERLSTYTVSLHAGPYKMWEDRSGKYPLRLFARQSVAARIAPQAWFKYTRQGLAYFDKYYGVPYPFKKYDQLLVPDFLFGAMENTAAVTFAERAFLHDGEMSEEQRHALASVILHEMAHQWFGDMVTMQWWNGVWLNESFASFMGTLATAESTEFKNGWQRFYANAKTRAYAQDQQVGTHAVEVPVASSAAAYDNLDAITYNKGASTLIQLRHLLGDDVFRRGVHNYLVKFAWNNATLDDFIATLGEASGRDLAPWAQQWLRQAGVNTVSADYRCSGGKVASFSLRQSAGVADDALREQRVQVALMRRQGRRFTLDRVAAVTYRGAATEVPALQGAACPDLVYPNYQDWGFAKVRLDPRSFATVHRHLQEIDSPFMRAMLWDSLWDGVRDGEQPLNEFLDIALNNAPAEKDDALLGELLRKANLARDYGERIAPNSRYVRENGKALEKMARDALRANQGAPNLQRHWLDFYLAVAASDEALDEFAGVLAGRQRLHGLELNQDVRWKIVQRLNRHNHPGSAALIDAELAADKTDRGQAAALAALVGRPDARIKAEWLAKVSDLKTTLSFARIRTAMAGLYPGAQGALSEQTAAQRLDQLAPLEKSAGPLYMRLYVETMLPATCSARSVQRLADAIAKQQDLSPSTRRALQNAHQEDARCVAMRGAMTVPAESL